MWTVSTSPMLWNVALRSPINHVFLEILSSHLFFLRIVSLLSLFDRQQSCGGSFRREFFGPTSSIRLSAAVQRCIKMANPPSLFYRQWSCAGSFRKVLSSHFHAQRSVHIFTGLQIYKYCVPPIALRSPTITWREFRRSVSSHFFCKDPFTPQLCSSKVQNSYIDDVLMP